LPSRDQTQLISCTGLNRPYVDFFKDVVAADPTHGPKDGATVDDDDTFVNIRRGQGVPLPPATNLGHFQLDIDAFVPPYRCHRAGWHIGQVDTRLSLNNRPGLFHNFAEDAGGREKQ
jgi:hypothetical protein